MNTSLVPEPGYGLMPSLTITLPEGSTAIDVTPVNMEGRSTAIVDPLSTLVT